MGFQESYVKDLFKTLKTDLKTKHKTWYYSDTKIYSPGGDFSISIVGSSIVFVSSETYLEMPLSDIYSLKARLSDGETTIYISGFNDNPKLLLKLKGD